MATLQQVIQLVFEGVDNASETAKKVSGSLDTLGGVATNIAEPFSNLAGIIEKTDATLLGLATIIGGLAVNASAKFTQSLSDLNRFLKEGEGSAEDYTDAFRALSSKYGISVNEIIDSTSDWSAANYKINQSLELTTIALDYATAGQISAAEATDLLKKILSGLNVDLVNSATTATRWGDIINFVADDSKSSFKELAIAVAALAPSFDSSGMSAEQFVAIIGSSVDLLQNGSMAADGLKTIFGFLTKTTDDGAAAFADFNVVVGAGNIVQGSVQQTLSKIAAIWPSLTAEQQRNAAVTLTSKERADQFRNILDQWPETAARATKAVSLSTESMAKEVERALATSIAAFNRFSQAVNQLLIALGLELEPTTVDVVDALSKLAQAFRNLVDSGALDPLLDLLRTQGKGLAELFRTIAANLPAAFEDVDLSGIVDAFGELGDAVQDFFDALLDGADLSTVEGLRRALQLVVDGGEALIQVSAGIVRAFIPFVESLRGTAQGFTQLDGASKVDFGEFLGAMQTIIVVGPKVAAAIILAAKAGIDWADSATSAFGAIKVAINTLQITFNLVALGTLKIVEAITEAKLAVLELTGGDWVERNRLKGVLDNIRASIDEFGAAADRNAKELKDGWQLATNDTSGNLNKLRDDLSKAETNISNFGKESNKTAVELQKLGDVKLPTFEVDTQKAAEGLKQVSAASQELVPKLVNVRDANGKIIYSYTELTNIIPGVTGTLSFVGTALDKNAKAAEEATKKSDDYLTKMEEIASNERIKVIEAIVDFKIANVEADAKKVQSAFESIDVVVKSTGDLIGSLFESLIGTKDIFKASFIRDQIEKENKRRQEALDMQKKLIEAQIARIEAQTRAMERGDAIIRIDGAGLKPQLEAFMWEILKAIRVRANAEFADYLLGLGATA
jgi:TP901 family phage tail tape measure protein